MNRDLADMLKVRFCMLAAALGLLAHGSQLEAGEFTIVTKKAEVQVRKTREGAVVLDIQSPTGIGSANIALRAGGWPDVVLVRLHLRGLESLRISSGTNGVSASVSSRGEYTVRVYRVEGNVEKPLSQGSPLWPRIRALEANGKPARTIPLENGYFEVALPKAFLGSQAKSVTIEWIDFFRG